MEVKIVKELSKPKFKPGKGSTAPPDVAAVSSEEHRLHGRLWIAGSGGTFLGYGRVVLLQRIKVHGSIKKAAGSMKMSYRHAWELIESMNSQSAKPLVIGTVGGKGGGGSRLTAEGERAIVTFWLLHKQFKEFLAGMQTQLENYAREARQPDENRK